MMKFLSLSLAILMIGCDASQNAGSDAMTSPSERKAQSNTVRSGEAVKMDRLLESTTDNAGQPGKAESLAAEALPAYDWQGRAALPLSEAAPGIDELDVMDLLLAFEDYYKIDITTADLEAVIGRQNLAESRKHLTLESISVLAGATKSD